MLGNYAASSAEASPPRPSAPDNCPQLTTQLSSAGHQPPLSSGPPETGHDPPSPAAADARAQAVITLMQADVRRNWKVAALAAQVNLSASRLAHLFKAALGVSIYQYLVGLRMERANCWPRPRCASVK
jgi:transcriptional regulator GlxA family with amidase domain